MRIKSVQIQDIMNSPPTNSGLKRKAVFHRKIEENLVPVYSASQDENLIFGWVERDSKWKIYKNVLTWNKDGSSGIVFYRKEEFVPYEKVKLLEIKDQFNSQLDYTFLKYVIENKLLSLGFGFNFKCSMQRVLEVSIDIPIKENGKFDLEKQREISGKYEKIEQIKNRLKEDYDKIGKFRVDISGKYETKLIPVTELFDSKKGNAGYTKKYMHDHKGEYPIYSSQTSDFGEIGKISTYDYDEECFTWTTDGIHAGTVFYRNGKFSVTTHCGILKLKEKHKGKINFEYLNFILNLTLPKNTLGEWANKRLGIERMREISIDIPIKENGEFDLDKQKEIADKYKKIEQIKNRLKEDYEKMINSKIQIIESNN
jgi:restriction endonuclease S subunit